MRFVSIDRKELPQRGMAGVVDAIGSDRFAARWAELVRESCGAAFVSAFRIANGRATVLVADGPEQPRLVREHAHRYADEMHWRDDPVIALAGSRREKDAVALVQVDTARIDSPVLRRQFYRPANVGEKLAISVPKENALFVSSILRTADSGLFTAGAVERVAGQAEILLGLLAKHASLTCNTATENSLASVGMVEARLSRAEASRAPWRLTNRERQVCARILYGLTAAGIALDLGINEYSVDTYRKRAYLRLGVATRHELLRRYLALDIAPAS